MSINIPASTLHRTIADVAEFLETNADANEWGFLDNGETLEIYSSQLEACRRNVAWTALEQRYFSVGGNIYCPDDNEWEVA
ncbi:hypothetical protein NDI39_29325 [Microcoleus sp. ZQ-A2]|nr:hypothetical protein [Microcoleus sp. FACHB-1]